MPEMFGWYYPDAAAVLADPDGRVIVTDGRNHLELATEQFDIIVTDPPPPIESSGASVISSYEYYQAGKAHLTPGGVMMQWVPYGAPESEFKEHIRTFAAVYPHVSVIKGSGGYGAYMLGSEQPMSFEPDAIREVLSRPGILEDISSAYDSPATLGRRLDRGDRPAALARRGRGGRIRRRRAAHHRRPPAPRVLPAAPAGQRDGRPMTGATPGRCAA